ncbi:trypsin-like serine protease, partial [Vibrio sp. D173a]|uniref:trypsin-like serine protease n=1 Tax=Vibrio sp. D173a TaxID=2836349 RepID=UPI002553E041
MKSALSKKWIWAGALPLIGSFAVCADTTTPTTESDANLESSAEITHYIVNGSNASVSDFPSIASLFIDSLEYDNFYTTNPNCGATILDQYHVLTAAHCIYGNETAQLFTTVVPQLENVNDYPFGNIQRYRVTEIYYRNDYDNRLSQLLANDVAILK